MDQALRERIYAAMETYYPWEIIGQLDAVDIAESMVEGGRSDPDEEAASIIGDFSEWRMAENIAEAYELLLKFSKPT